MATEVAQPTKMVRPKVWDEHVEEAYRFQLAGYRDERDYIGNAKGEPERWPGNGFIKKLKRKNDTWYYYNKTRECPDKDINKCKLYQY